MDGPQYRYNRVTQTKEYLVDKIPGVDIVAKRPSNYFYDEKAEVLYIHTSDGKPPATHEIEIIRRLSGISTLEGKRYLTVIGFTFRHMGDSGIYFYKESGDGVAINNTSYGSRQGIRVYNSTHITIIGNTLFRNENSGTYFVQDSTNGLFIGNITYENVKGVRWGSQSVNGVAIDNTLFDNLEAGISIEDVYHAILRRNRMVNNGDAQLMVLLNSQYDSDDNCFQNGVPEQSIAHFSNVSFYDRQKTLADYQKVKSQDLHSRDGGCEALPQKIDVHKLHAETMSYTERARKILKEAAESSSQAPKQKQ
jgi:parallel beta-helix repeat protein